jgi:hypothetical protein
MVEQNGGKKAGTSWFPEIRFQAKFAACKLDDLWCHRLHRLTEGWQ